MYVDLDVDRLVAREGRALLALARLALASVGITLATGARAEVSPAAVGWVRDAARRLKRGFMVLIDYGHEARTLYADARLDGTLTTYRQHQQRGGESGASWLEHPGEQDITAQVDFTSVRAAAEAEGCITLGLLDQTYS